MNRNLPKDVGRDQAVASWREPRLSAHVNTRKVSAVGELGSAGERLHSDPVYHDLGVLEVVHL